MRILALSPRQCWPAQSGAKLREYHLLNALGKASELTLQYFSDTQAKPPAPEDLPFCHEIEAISRPKAYTAGRLIRGIAGKWPLPVLNYDSAEMMRRVTLLGNSRHFDFVHAESIHMVRYANALQAALPSIGVIYDWHNIESEAMERYGESADSAARAWYAGMTARKLRRLEDEVLRNAAGHLVCSEREKSKLLQRVPSARIAEIENGVDCDFFAGDDKPHDGRERLVFVGSMDYHPNIDGAVWFAREVWPALRSQIPGAELQIVGARPSSAVEELGGIPGVEVTGTVPDVRPYYRGALAAIVPLRTGGGTRLKILEAMAAGVPVISTALGAEGLEVVPGKHFLLSDAGDSGSWVRNVASLKEQPELRAAFVESGLRLARERYDWRILGAKLVDTYRDWMERTQ